MKKEWTVWLVSKAVLIVIAAYVFWPRGPVHLPLAGENDPVFELYRSLPCRDEFPSGFRAVVRFYDDNGVRLPEKVYTITPVSVHEGAVSNRDVDITTGWYWVAPAKIDWCKTLQDLLAAKDYKVSAGLQINNLRLSSAGSCFKKLCDFSLNS